ncbi:MAG: SpoIIE family protein phosphatase [Terriglobia bacterium]
MVATVDAVAPRALIVDDQQDILEALHLLLKNEGYETELVNSPHAVIESLKARSFDLLLMDLNYARDTTSGQEGLDLVARVREIDSTLPIIVMTAWGTVPLAVETMRRGVRDFVQKPWENAELVAKLNAQVEWSRTERERRRREQIELEDARDIERRLLPTDIPQIPGYEISGSWQPASNVGGDYFDVLSLGEERAGLCIADVVGKGVPAALLMSNLQAAVKAAGPDSLQPSRLAAKLNQAMSQHLAQGKFITFFYGVLDGPARKLTYTSAGHNPPILMRADGSHLRLEQGGAALGLFETWNYEEGQVDLKSKDRLVLFTDGVTEASNMGGEEYGESRLLSLLRDNRGLRATDLQTTIMQAVMQFTGGALEDDATLIVTAVD